MDFSVINGDKINLVGYGPNEVQHALSSVVVAGGSATVTLSDKTEITFSNVTNLNKSDFS